MRWSAHSNDTNDNTTEENTMSVITIDRRPGSRRLDYLPDYCPRCNPAGDRADRPVRLASLTEPTSITWPGGRRLICEYQCNACSHQWVRTDLWSAEQAGFDPKQRRTAA
ncbi:hypothetical protein MMON_58170 [Mycolicibacterium monacense]|uniref:Uncharacterized protein n=2 Tax=Mycolicibacterium monacense TaxID=85693 RepID=A0AAD1J4S6_MYCMB|nr:hypothetical protein [Mycolicibacterium monacense DSM 44395]BBZ64516.1 hypothetical protein MMON_58170 [Mycolicibacterium monacense]